MSQAHMYWAGSQNTYIEVKSLVSWNPQKPEAAGQGVGKTHRGTAGDTTTAEEELILVYNYGGVPAMQRRGSMSQRTPNHPEKEQSPPCSENHFCPRI